MAFDKVAFQAALIHEMKNHLALLGMTLERLPASGDPVHDSTLDEARLLCQRVGERMRQALWLYRAEQGPLVPDIDAYSPHDLVQALAAQTRSLARERFEVSVELADELPAIAFFDRELIEMALMNAIQNSLVYARSRIVLAARADDGWLCLSVRDDSDGYPEGIIRGLADGTPYRAHGTGLGLQFAQLIARLHENLGRSGELKLANENGAVFSLLLP